MSVPHSIYSEQGQVSVTHNLCSRCQECVKICPADALTFDKDMVQMRDSSFGCIACGHCAMVCPQNCIVVTGRGLVAEDIISLPSREASAGPESLEALLLSRRSIRHFSDQEVDLQLLEKIVELAAAAPMAIPPWDVGCVIVNGRQKIREITKEVIEGYQGFLKLFRPWVLKLMRPFLGQAKYEQFRDFICPLAQTYVAKAAAGKDVLLWDAPSMLVFHHSRFTDIVDATIPCTYAMLAAESLGLGSTIIGGVPPILQRNPKLCRNLGIPEGHVPALALIVGHPAVRFRRAVKRRFVSVNRVC